MLFVIFNFTVSMKSDCDSEHNSEPQRPYSDTNQINLHTAPKIVPRKKVAKSADHEPEQNDNGDFLIEQSEHIEQIPIQRVIKREDLVKEYQFGKQIVRSEQFSVDAQLLQSANKQKLHREIRARQDYSKKLQLNIMVCGSKQIGKTSFIEAFQNSKLCGIEHSKSETTEINLRKFVRKVDGQIYDITMVDTPGYREEHIEEYIRLIVNNITERLESHYWKQEECKTSRNKIILGGKADDVDERIHCCLYFLKGPKVHQDDCKVMKTLQKYVNIIPILARGDCYTMEEIKKFKRDLFLAKQKHGLMWMECQEILRAKNPQFVKLLLEGPFGVAPPFVIVSGVSNIITSSNRVIQGRVYNWGMIDISNPNHSDFSLLSEMILQHFSRILVELTSFIEIEYIRELDRQQFDQENQRKNKQQIKKKKKLGFLSALGQGLVVGAVGWVLYKFVQSKTEKG